MRRNPLDSDEFPGGEKDEVEPAGLASAVDVNPVVGLLFSDVLGGLVFAGGHQGGLGKDTIYAFSGRSDRRSQPWH